jgi:SNF2 family DNA or RNA helicase
LFRIALGYVGVFPIFDNYYQSYFPKPLIGIELILADKIASSVVSKAILEDLDIVITSYNEVMKEFPFPNKKERAEIARIGYERWSKGAIQNLGVLHQVSWYRVVLDEAQAIKNNGTRTSLACQNLKSVYRWCLAGTPLLNRLEE